MRIIEWAVVPLVTVVVMIAFLGLLVLEKARIIDMGKAEDFNKKPWRT